MLHPEFPIVEGRYQVTEDWAVTLPGPFNQRFQDDSLVLWRPGVTIWTIVWNNDKNESAQQRLEWLREDISPEAFDEGVVEDCVMVRFTYRLNEVREEGIVLALYAFAIGDGGHVQMAIYFDHEDDLEVARQIAGSLEETQAGD